MLNVSLQGRVNPNTIGKAVQKRLSHFWPLAEIHTPHPYKSNKSCEHLNHVLNFWESWLSQTIFIVIFQICFLEKNLRRVFIIKAPHALTLLLLLVLRVSVCLATSVKGKSKVLLVPKEFWLSNSSYQLNYFIGPRILHNFECHWIVLITLKYMQINIHLELDSK